MTTTLWIRRIGRPATPAHILDTRSWRCPIAARCNCSARRVQPTPPPPQRDAWTTFPCISRLGPNFPTSAEMRAAVGLLTRDIRIISDGNTPGVPSEVPFPVDPGNPDNYFGGHTIVRQGFLLYQVQGVEFHQLGQGGAIMHYPVHFHMARQTPVGIGGGQPITFVKDA